MMMFRANPSQIISNLKSSVQFPKLTQQKWNRNLSNVKNQRTSKFGLTNKSYQSKRAASFGSEDGEKAIERRILITGCLGQIGTELVALLRRKYGSSNVIASDVRRPEKTDFLAQGPWAYLDVTDPASFHRVIVEYRIDWLIHNSSILSAAGERNPQLAMDINVKGLHNALEAAKTHNLRIFAPSSIAAFGPTTPRDSTPNLTIMRPTTIYGVTKVYLELLGSYYAMKYGVDFRSLRYPGIISAETLPGGGTTDYAVEIYYEALKHGKYTSFLKSDSELPMMYMPDCLKATQKILEVDPELLTDRVYNVTAFSFTPEQLANSIKKYIPDFKIDYKPDFRQKIADSWPKSLDDTLARRDWNWKPDFDLDSMTRDMLIRLKAKLQSQDPNLKLKQIHNV